MVSAYIEAILFVFNSKTHNLDKVAIGTINLNILVIKLYNGYI
jgi:hypothetical protein